MRDLLQCCTYSDLIWNKSSTLFESSSLFLVASNSNIIWSLSLLSSSTSLLLSRVVFKVSFSSWSWWILPKRASNKATVCINRDLSCVWGVLIISCCNLDLVSATFSFWKKRGKNDHGDTYQDWTMQVFFQKIFIIC